MQTQLDPTELKHYPLVDNKETWQEITTLKVINMANTVRTAEVLFVDGKEKPIASTQFQLSPEDVDELNVCRTLQAGNIVVPQEGLAEIVIRTTATEQQVGVYAWMKNLLGKFFKTENEPFKGRVSGVSKTECRVVPSTVVSIGDISFKIGSVPPIQPILVEDTAPDLTP